MTKRAPGVFDPWRQKPPEEAPAPVPAFDEEPPALRCVVLAGGAGSLHVWLPENIEDPLGAAQARARRLFADLWASQDKAFREACRRLNLSFDAVTAEYPVDFLCAVLRAAARASPHVAQVAHAANISPVIRG